MMGKNKRNNVPHRVNSPNKSVEKCVELLRSDWRRLQKDWPDPSDHSSHEGYKWRLFGYFYGAVIGWYKTIDRDGSEDYRSLFPNDNEPEVPYSRQEMFCRVLCTYNALVNHRYNEIPREVENRIAAMFEELQRHGTMGIAPSDDEVDDDEMSYQATHIFWKGYLDFRALDAVPGQLPPLFVATSRNKF